MNKIIGICLKSSIRGDSVNIERSNGIKRYHSVNRARLEKISILLAVGSIAPTQALFLNSEVDFGRFIAVRYGTGAFIAS